MFRIRTPQNSRTKFRNLITLREESAALSTYATALFTRYISKQKKTIIYAHVENQSPTRQVMFLRFTAVGSFRGLARGRRDLHLHRQF